MDGSIRPNTDTLKKIAEFFDVSCDYLVGISKEHSKDRDLKPIFEQMGITSNSINIIKSFDEMELSIFNLIFENEHIVDLLKKLKEAFVDTVTFALKEPHFIFTFPPKYDNEVYMRVKQWELNKEITKIVDNIYGDYIAVYWHDIEMRVKEQMDKESRTLYDEFGFPIVEILSDEEEESESEDNLYEFSTEEIENMEKHEGEGDE
jgi:hypothetical protein